MKSRKLVMFFGLWLFLGFVSIAMAGSEGDTNTFYGKNAGSSMTDGNQDTFIGAKAGSKNTSGLNNAFIGFQAGSINTTGSYNSFHGSNAGMVNTTGSVNTFVGNATGYANTSGSSNTFLGHTAGFSNTTGGSNTFVGRQAGYNTTSSYGSVFLGYQAGYNETGSNKLCIDNSDTSTPLIWGDFNTNEVVVYGGFRAIASYSSSDGRLKKNIQPLESPLEKVSSLKGISYEWRKNEYPDMGFTGGKQVGLIAQNVEKTMPELVSEGKDGYKAVSYTRLTAVLVEAIKELKNLSAKQQAENERQQAEIERLRELISELKS